jgi:glycosyltransferase involved in cell wall biosynthesis
LPNRSYAGHLLENFSGRLTRETAARRFDLLLQDELCHPSFCLRNRRLRKKAQCPLVAIVHQVLCRQPRNPLRNRIYETVEKAYLNSVDAFIFNSRTTRCSAADLVAGRRPSIVACPAGNRLGRSSSPDWINARATIPGPLRLIFVGNVLPNKGLLPLIRQLSHLPADAWHLTVAGSLEMDRGYANKVRKTLAAQTIRNQVALAGPVDTAELASLLDRSHVFIMPYSHESFGMAHLEAMGFGLPVIGSSNGAVKEFVQPEQNGFLIDPGDTAATLNCLKRLHNDRQLLAKMSQAALQTFQERPGWDDTMAVVYRFLCDLGNENLR